MARILTSAVFLKANYLVLVIRDEDHRNMYLDALESADGGDLSRLVNLFADVQITDLQRAIDALRSVRGETILKVTETLAERAKRRLEEVHQQTAGTLGDLLTITEVRLEEAVGELRRAFESAGVDVDVDTYSDGEDSREWWSWQIVEAAKTHGYFADLNRPRRWVALRLRLPGLDERDARLVFSFHAVGRSADLHSVSVFLTRRSDTGEGLNDRRWDCDIIPDYPFRFSAESSRLEAIEPKFREWLESTIELGLAEWGKDM